MRFVLVDNGDYFSNFEKEVMNDLMFKIGDIFKLIKFFIFL